MNCPSTIPAEPVHSEATRARFAARVRRDEVSGCLIWQARTDGKGYGTCPMGKRGASRLAHRVSYELHNGAIPDGLSVLHRCDTPLCVEPAHLFLGTQAENMRDMAEKGRGRGNSKITENDVRQIRALRATGMLLKDIAATFGVSDQNAGLVCSHRTWKHVEAPPATPLPVIARAIAREWAPVLGHSVALECANNVVQTLAIDDGLAVFAVAFASLRHRSAHFGLPVDTLQAAELAGIAARAWRDATDGARHPGSIDEALTMAVQS